MKFLTMSFLCLLFVSCEFLQEDEIDDDDFDFKSTASCTFSMKQEYRVLQDITADFDQALTDVISTVTDSNCSSPQVGETSSETAGRLKRVGNTITIYSDSSSDSVTVAGNGTDVSIPSGGTIQDGSVTLRVSFTDAYLNTSNDYLVFESDVVVTEEYYNFITSGESQNRPLIDHLEKDLQNMRY